MSEHIHNFVDCLSHAGVTSLETLRTIHAQHARSKLHDYSTPTYAEINHGRWLINCECHGAAVTCRTAKIACCFDCGRVHLVVKFPRNAAKIEEILLARPMANRNWKKGETVKFLMAENVEHGLNRTKSFQGV